MEWSRYYEESDILPLKSQEIYYTYLLDQLKEFITENKTQTDVLAAALGGLHPKVTKPEHFHHLCKAVFSQSVHTFIVEQNEQVLNKLTPDNDTTLVHTQLENLPDFIPPLSLLVCDFTLDFMTDKQIRRLGATLKNKLDTNGIFILAHDEPAIPILVTLQQKFKYGIRTQHRRTRRICKLLPDLKCIYDGLTRQNFSITVFTHQDSPFPVHQGSAFSLDPCDNSSLANWIVTK